MTIAFHNDSLVPPELCRLLALSIPDELHVPVVFFNNRAGYVASNKPGPTSTSQ